MSQIYGARDSVGTPTLAGRTAPRPRSGIQIRSKQGGIWKNVNLVVKRSSSGRLMLIRDDGFDLLDRDKAIELMRMMLSKI